ncbi:MAG: transporter substrate-binding domain-containing protein [Chromatiales bacterium]
MAGCLFVGLWLLVVLASMPLQAANDELVIAYRYDSEPVQFTDVNGNAAGVLIDLWRLWAELSGSRIRFVAGDNVQTQEMLRDGRADVIAGLFRNEQREQFLDFSAPILNSSYHLYYRDGIVAISSLEDVGQRQVGVTAGSFHENFLRENYPAIKIASYTGYNDLFDAAAAGEIDFFITQPLFLDHYLRSRHGVIKFNRLSPPLYSRAYQAGVAKHNKPLLQKINRYLASISLPQSNVIMSRWLGVQMLDQQQTTSQFTLSEAEKQWLAAHRPIRVGVMDSWPPFDFIDENGVLHGIGSDYIKALNRRLGNVLIPVPGNWQRTYDDVAAKRLDAVMDITPSVQRQATFNFTSAYLSAPHVIIARRQQPYLASEEDLRDKTVALEQGFVNVAYFQQNYPHIRVKLYADTARALDAVARGEADAYAGNRAAALFLIDQRLLTNLQVHGQLSKPPTELAIGVRKDWPQLRDILQRALDDISTQERHAIVSRWVSLPASGQPLKDAVSETPQDKAVSFTQQELDWLEQHRSLRLGVDASWAPLEYIDEKGRYQGLSSSYMHLFAKQLGVHMAPPKRLPWEEVLEDLKNKHLDIAPLLAPTKLRRDYLLFTKSYLDFPLVIFNRQGQTLLAGLQDLQGKKVAVVGGYAVVDYLQQDHPDLQLVKYASASRALEAVSVNEVDAFIGPLAVGGYLITHEGYSNLQVGASTPYTYHLSIGVRNDWPELVSIFNKLIDNLTAQTRNQIINDWLSVTYRKQVDYRLLWQMFGIAALIFLLGAIWINQLQRSRQALYESGERLSMALDGARLGAWQVDTDENGAMTVSMNETFAMHHGLPEGVTQMPFEDFLLYIDKPGRQRIRRETQRFLSNRTQRLVIEYQPADKERWLFSQGRIFRSPRKNERVRVIGITQDITERKQAQLMLEQASRFKSEFLANVSHEIRTPMNAIVGLGHLLSRTTLADKQKDYVDKMQVSAQSLLAIIDDVLDFSKIEAGQLKVEKIEFDLDEIFSNLATLTAVRLGDKPVEYVYQIDPQVPKKLISDPYRLSQILTNLVSNAVKFTDTGSILVRVSVQQQQPLQLLFEVIDSGIGIEPERLEQLFEAFVQADGSTTRRYGGTGLGLSISKQLTRLLGGSIGVESTPGQGSRFYFSLPMQVAETGKPLVIPDLRNKQVLLVDDNPMAREVLADMLRSLSFQVTAVASGAEALQQLEHAETAPELVLLDWYMPDMDGEQTAGKIRQTVAGKELTIIAMITAYGRQAVEHHIDSALLDGIVVKPLTSSQLFDAIMQTSSEHAVADRMPQSAAALKWQSELLVGEVLLVEDKHINQQVARELLQQMGLQVRVSSNGQKALDFVRRHKPDLVLMDIQMPEMDGYQATREIRKIYPSDILPILAMTAHAMVGDAEKSLRAGMNGHVTKPVNPQLLYHTLAQWLPKKPSEPVAQLPAAAVVDEPVWPDALPGINLAAGLKQIGGNRELYQRLLQEFIENHGQAADHIEQALQQNDLETARREAHSLRGIAANIGAEPLAKAAATIDEALQQQRQVADDALNSFREVCRQLTDSLRQFLVETAVNDNSSDIDD